MMVLKQVAITMPGVDNNYITVYNTTPDELRAFLNNFYRGVRNYPYCQHRKSIEEPLIQLVLHVRNTFKGANRYNIRINQNGTNFMFTEQLRPTVAGRVNTTPDLRLSISPIMLKELKDTEVVRSFDGKLFCAATLPEFDTPMVAAKQFLLKWRVLFNLEGTDYELNLENVLKDPTSFTKLFETPVEEAPEAVAAVAI